MRVLVLGGTTEASALARLLAGDARFDVMLSLAGRTERPAPQPVPVRVGGFGGADGLADHLLAEGVQALVDATHPFAKQMTANAAAAARATGVALLVVRRPGWVAEPGDAWQRVASLEAAAMALGEAPRRVFLTVGRKELSPFAAAPWHRYVIRSVDPPPAALLPHHAELITARGPFDEADEHRLLAGCGIEVLVTKDSGGAATYPKLLAARRLGVPVIMVERPPVPEGVELVGTAEAAMAWLEAGHRALLGA